jgi:hypothetical protein
MLKALLKRAGVNAARVRVQATDARRWRPAATKGPSSVLCRYDLVVSHFFLDCLTTEEIRSLARDVMATVEPGALWIVSEFAVPAGRFGRWVAAPLVAVLYCAFGLLTGLHVRRLPDHRSALKDAGFRLRQTRRWLGGLLVSELWQAREND